MTKTAKGLVILSVFFVFFVSASSRAAEREGCAICGMYLDMYAKTRYAITLDDGSARSTCSLACATRIMDENKGHVKDIKVGNYLSGELIDARSASFLEGSDVRGVMSRTSRIAFPSKQDALEFQKKHGGKIVTFDEAVRDQVKERE